MAFHNLVNTRYFSEAAIDWVKNGGRYTTAPHGSRDYMQYWEEQDKRCKYGYKVADTWISGRHYGYLNFFPISRVPEKVLMANLAEGSDKRGKISRSIAEKIVGFPAFWEIDYEWWMFKHISWYGGDFMGIHSEGGKHLGCLKTRGAGFSYKEAWDGIYNYNFIDGSKSYYFAATEPFLIGDAIMDKVAAGLDWINTYSPYWKKNRQVKKTLMHQKASYLDERTVEKGTFSEIIGQIVDKSSKTRGKRGRKATFEEAGSFPALEDALEVCMGSMREGGAYVGQISVFGTGGETGPGIQGLENIFNYPEAWDMLAFPNIWEEGLAGTQCGYFVPCYRANAWFMDQSGNVDMDAAILNDDIARGKKAKTGKPKDLDRRKAEYPRNPAEALQRLSGNGFNIAEIDAQIKRVISNKAIHGSLRYGRMISSTLDERGADFLILPKLTAKPIEIFPHTPKDDIRGCVTIWQEPIRDQNGHVPAGVYDISIDSFYNEDAEDKTSLFSCKVWKTENPFDPSWVDLPMAWYAGRPARLDEVYEQLFGLAKYYNAKIQGEIAGGGVGIVTYAKTYRLLQYLYNEPEMAHNKEIASKAAGNSFLMNMATDRKKLGTLYLEDWHVAPRAVDENGKMVLNIHYIYDIAWLYELKKFNPEKGNFDRVSDAIIEMFMLKEKRALMVKHRRETREFYEENRVLFGGSSTEIGNMGMTTSY